MRNKMKRTVVCFIVGMIGVVQCFFCMAEEVTAKKGPGLWGFDSASCEKIQTQIKAASDSDIKQLCGQSSEQLAAKIAIMQVLLLKKQLELQQKNVVIDISSGKIKELAQGMYLTGDSANEEKSLREQGATDGQYWYDQRKKSRFLEWIAALDIYSKYYCGVYFYKREYFYGVYSGSQGYFEWLW